MLTDWEKMVLQSARMAAVFYAEKSACETLRDNHSDDFEPHLLGNANAFYRREMDLLEQLITEEAPGSHNST